MLWAYCGAPLLFFFFLQCFSFACDVLVLFVMLKTEPELFACWPSTLQGSPKKNFLYLFEDIKGKGQINCLWKCIANSKEISHEAVCSLEGCVFFFRWLVNAYIISKIKLQRQTKERNLNQWSFWHILIYKKRVNCDQGPRWHPSYPGCVLFQLFCCCCCFLWLIIQTSWYQKVQNNTFWRALNEKKNSWGDISG